MELTQLEWLHPKEKVFCLQSLQFQYHSLLKSIPVTRIIELQDRLIELETPVRALAPGQAGVYKGNQVLGGGMINRTIENGNTTFKTCTNKINLYVIYNKTH